MSNFKVSYILLVSATGIGYTVDSYHYYLKVRNLFSQALYAES